MSSASSGCKLGYHWNWDCMDQTTFMQRLELGFRGGWPCFRSDLDIPGWNWIVMTWWRDASTIRLENGSQPRHETNMEWVGTRVSHICHNGTAGCTGKCNCLMHHQAINDSETGARLQGRMMTSQIEAARGPDLRIEMRSKPSDLQWGGKRSLCVWFSGVSRLSGFQEFPGVWAGFGFYPTICACVTVV